MQQSTTMFGKLQPPDMVTVVGIFLAISSSSFITPDAGWIQSSRLRRSVVAEHPSSAILQYAQPNTRTCTSFSKTTLSGTRGR